MNLQDWYREKWMASIPAALRRPANGGHWVADGRGAREHAKAKAARAKRKARIEQLQAQGVGLDDIAADIGVTRHGLLYFMRTNGLNAGLRVPAAKRRALAPKIMSLRDQGLTQREIAVQLGLSRWAVGETIREARA